MLTEGKTVEFKREYVDDIKKTAAAFANSDGGTVYIGIDDDGTVVGVADADATVLRVINALRDSVRPDVTMFVDCGIDETDGKKVVVLSVQRGTARPYYLREKGIRPEGVYVRQGSSTVPASDAAILAMIKETGGDSFESARSVNQQLTFEYCTAFFEKAGLELETRQMKTLHLIGEDGTYTNLALLLSEQCTHTLKLAVFEGSKKTVFKDRSEFSGSLLKQLEDAFAYIDRYNRTRAEFHGLERLESRDYPSVAVREALLNAVVHRDYSFSGSTLISIFDDRIEFVSIGGLVKGISLDDVLLGVSALRNQYLANIFYRLKLIEAYGTGILKINESYSDSALKPSVETTSNAFKIVLPNVNYVKENKAEAMEAKHALSSGARDRNRAEAVANLCRKQGFVIRKDVEAALQVSQSTAVLLLRKMVDDGVLVKSGTAKGLRYRLAD